MPSRMRTQPRWHSRVGFLVDQCLFFFIIKIIANYFGRNMVFFWFRLVFCKIMILSGWVSIFVHAVTLLRLLGHLRLSIWVLHFILVKFNVLWSICD